MHMFRCHSYPSVLACALVLSCGGVTPRRLGPENCTNKIDDNGDGKVDCSDPKCFDDEACQGQVEKCDNDIDDNVDGKVDCLDVQCVAQSCGQGCTCIGGVKVRVNQDGGTGGGTGGGNPGLGGGSGGGNATGGAGGGTGGGNTGFPAWEASAWGSCSNQCGSGTQTRAVICKQPDGTPVADSMCSGAKPSASQACSESAGCTPCSLPWGGTLAHGSSVQAYNQALPSGACTAQTRVCDQGTLSGSYVNRTCSAGCTLPWGGTITSGSSVNAYYVRFGSKTQPCEHTSTVQNRVCNDGTLSGTYTWQSCKNYPCPEGGANFMDQAVSFPSGTNTVGAAALSCYGPSATFKSAIYTGPGSGACQWGTRWFEATVCGYYMGSAYRCFAGTWSVVSSGVNGCPQSP